MDAVAVAAAILGDRAVADAPLAPLTTYKVGGRAALLAMVDQPDDIALVGRAVATSGIPVLVVGKGSNLLVADAGFPGLAVMLGDGFTDIDELDANRVRAGAGVSRPVLARRTAAASLTGFEWAVGVPGSVGGGVRMNAGGHGSDIGRSLQVCRIVDLATGSDLEVGVGELGLGYRRSRVGPAQVVIWAELQLAPGDRSTSEQTITEIVRWRRENQPGGQNAGSVFTNPKGYSAGRLVDAAGLRGLRHGSAQVSEKHANFIQAGLGGSADDVAALIDEVIRRVADHTGVLLHTEVRMIGFARSASSLDELEFLPEPSTSFSTSESDGEGQPSSGGSG